MDVNDFDRLERMNFTRWRVHFLLPYAMAYETAHGRFKDKLKDQSDADKAALELKVGLALFALSVAGGSLLTTVFGSSVLKTVAKEMKYAALENQWKLTFKAAGFVQKNETAQFILGEVWNKSRELLGSKLESSFDENASNYSGLRLEDGLLRRDDGLTPGNQKSQMELWLESVSLKARESAEQMKQYPDVLGAMTFAPYFAFAPRAVLDQEKAALEIELSFWMMFVMDLDYLETGEWKLVRIHRDMERYQKTVTSRTSIEVDPLSKKYPKDSSSRGSGSFQKVEYRQIGDLVTKRIDELNKIHFNHNFFQRDERVSGSVISRAYENLSALCQRNRARANLESLAREAATAK